MVRHNVCAKRRFRCRRRWCRAAWCASGGGNGLCSRRRRRHRQTWGGFPEEHAVRLTATAITANA